MLLVVFGCDIQGDMVDVRLFCYNICIYFDELLLQVLLGC